MKSKILVAEDAPEICEILQYILENAHYEVMVTNRGDRVLPLVLQVRPDLVILDIGLPGLSGLEVCPQLIDLEIPVLVLSSHNKDDEIIEGLELGAEDYVTKPFNHRELLIRIEKIIRRTRLIPEQDVLTIGKLEIDLKKYEVRKSGSQIHLTPTEFEIVKLLAKQAGIPVSTQTMLKKVWGNDQWTNGEDLVKVNIRRIRKKIEIDPTHPTILINRWGQGYLLVQDP